MEDGDVAKPLKSNSEDDKDENAVKPLKFNIEDEDIFKFSQKAANTFKSKSDDVHITGSFHKSGKCNWILVYGKCGKAYVLKAQFISVYVNCLLRDWEKVKNKGQY